MPYDLELAESEEVIANLTYLPSANSQALHIAVTNRAIYLPRKKPVAKVDPTYFERVPISEVFQVRIKKLRPIWMLIVALLMFVVGSAITFIMLLPYFHGQRGDFSGYPPAIAICGLVIPFLVRNRFGLEISCVRKGFRWRPPLLIDKESRLRTQDFYNILLEACAQAGIPTLDDRTDSAKRADSTSTAGDKYPVAGLPDEGGSGVTCPCTTCGGLLRMSRWDRWNNFLVQCPHCHYPHGRHWKIQSFLLAGLILNCLSFFLTLRPTKAFPLFFGWIVLWGGLFYAEKAWNLSDRLQFALFIVAILGPTVINAFVVIRHETGLSRSTTWLGDK